MHTLKADIKVNEHIQFMKWKKEYKLNKAKWIGNICRL